MNEKHSQIDHEYCEELLPWFVNGTLGEREQATVRQHLDECGSCQRAVEELSMIQDGVRNAAVTPMVPEPNPEKFLAALDDRQSRSRHSVSLFAAAAAAVLLVVAISYLSIGNSPPLAQRFETATSTQRPSGMDFVLDIEFVDGIPASHREKVLEDIGAKRVDATGAPGVFRIVVERRAASMEELDRFTRELAETGDVASVRIVALQLPVSRDP